ncbi:MAG: carbohydrate ABC transporter permease [Clostridia bacterium]|nr:carbohydrate ABC transporter permease [Clostridia bacterium]
MKLLKKKNTSGSSFYSYSVGDKIADFIILALLALFAFTIIFPFYNMIILSLSDYASSSKTAMKLIPKDLSLVNYKIIFSDPKLLSSIYVSLFVTVVGVVMSMGTTILAGYALSRKSMPGRKWVMLFFIIPMFFSGGLIPWYLVVTNLGLNNSLWAIILPSIVNVFYVILMKNYFNTIPDSLLEAARMDGATEWQVLIRVVLPIAKPILATIALFLIVDKWNDWWTAKLFIQDSDKMPLQLLIRNVVIESSMDIGSEKAQAMKNSKVLLNPLGIQMASVVVATLPILFIYPLLQKHFSKGILLGSLKE